MCVRATNKQEITPDVREMSDDERFSKVHGMLPFQTTVAAKYRKMGYACTGGR